MEQNKREKLDWTTRAQLRVDKPARLIIRFVVGICLISLSKCKTNRETVTRSSWEWWQRRAIKAPLLLSSSLSLTSLSALSRSLLRSSLSLPYTIWRYLWHHCQGHAYCQHHHHPRLNDPQMSFPSIFTALHCNNDMASWHFSNIFSIGLCRTIKMWTHVNKSSILNSSVPWE